MGVQALKLPRVTQSGRGGTQRRRAGAPRGKAYLDMLAKAYMLDVRQAAARLRVSPNP